MRLLGVSLLFLLAPTSGLPSLRPAQPTAATEAEAVPRVARVPREVMMARALGWRR